MALQGGGPLVFGFFFLPLSQEMSLGIMTKVVWMLTSVLFVYLLCFGLIAVLHSKLPAVCKKSPRAPIISDCHLFTTLIKKNEQKPFSTLYLWRIPLLKSYHSPVDTISLHPGKPVLIHPQHQLKAPSHTLDVLGALQRKEANVYSNRSTSLSCVIRKTNAC